MLINNQSIDLNDLVDNKYMHKEIGNGIYLSDYQLEILNYYHIDPYKCGSVNDLIMLIEEILDEEVDADDLDQVSKEIAEFNYYANTNK